MRSDTNRPDTVATQAPDQHESVRLGSLEHYLAFHLRMAQCASFKAFKRRSGDCSLKPGWFALLSLIGDNPGITPMALSRASGRDKSTLTPVLRELAANCMIERQELKGDKRSYTLSLTAKGKCELAVLATHAIQHDREIEEIAGSDKDVLLDLLRRITAQFD
ncbi:DNA-binding MarR family transcriptional regulator [Hoeflea marina]|uniref:DNA-binding MarR family transcriptional regulator n=1 Tax=Hoeflea marina TaxID=274592 RepID=A0A317PI63_9HYPH|nr:MarR family transcriptional regulator [Hoeflea marina]PWW00034.1 DNA-binding MarR family transcriptional regulator [Hoeflea marina]